MAQINEMENYEDIRNALEGSISSPYSWKIRQELRDKLNNAYTLERTQMINYDYGIQMAGDELFRDFCARAETEEELHQAMLGTLFGPETDMTPWNMLLWLELAFTRQMASNIQSEQNVLVKSSINYILLDHLSHIKDIANYFLRLGLGEGLVEEIRQLPDGRPLNRQFCETKYLLKKPYQGSDDPVTKVNLRLAKAWELGIREMLMGLLLAAPMTDQKLLIRELSVIESQHITMINSMISSEESLLEQTFYDELAEVTALNKMFAAEKEKSAREVYEFIISEDERHLKILGGLLYDFEGKDPAELSQSKALYAQPRRTSENYLKDIADKEVDLTAADLTEKKIA